MNNGNRTTEENKIAEQMGKLRRADLIGRGMILNAAVAVYVLFFQGAVTRIVNEGISAQQTNITLALFFFLFSMLEGVAYTAKMRLIIPRHLPRIVTANALVIFSVPLLFRLILGFVSATAVSVLITSRLRENTSLASVALGMSGVLVLKELYVALSFFFLVRKPGAKKKPRIPESLWDFILLVHICLSSTIFLLPGMFFKAVASWNIALWILYGIIILLAFFCLQITMLVEEYLSFRSIKDPIKSIAGLLVAVIGATLRLIK